MSYFSAEKDITLRKKDVNISCFRLLDINWWQKVAESRYVILPSPQRVQLWKDEENKISKEKNWRMKIIWVIFSNYKISKAFNYCENNKF